MTRWNEMWRLEIYDRGHKVTDLYGSIGLSLIDLIGLGGCRVNLHDGGSAIYTRVRLARERRALNPFEHLLTSGHGRLTGITA